MEAMLHSFRKKKVDSAVLNSLQTDDGTINRGWKNSDKKASVQVKAETVGSLKENYVQVRCEGLFSLGFSNIMDFSKESMCRLAFKLREGAGNIKKDAVKVRVIYLNVKDGKSDKRIYNWFYFSPDAKWQQDNVIIIPPDDKTLWNKIEVTIFFEPGQYDIRNMRLETW